VKVIKNFGNTTADEMLQRFHREAQVIAQLRSPHTMDLYAFGATPNGHLYYAMELLDGCGLDELVKRSGPLSPDRDPTTLPSVLLPR
jgi:eukaryotic-like serine/threonine-protein kinase